MSNITATFQSILLQIWSYDGVKVIVLHVAFNVIVAVAAALYTSTFNLKKLADFLIKKLLPYVLVYFAIKLFGDAIGLAGFALVVWAVIEATLIGDLTDSLALLGLKLPDTIMKLIGKRPSVQTQAFRRP